MHRLIVVFDGGGSLAAVVIQEVCGVTENKQHGQLRSKGIMSARPLQTYYARVSMTMAFPSTPLPAMWLNPLMRSRM